MSQHTKPCGECPFRRRSMPGYLGSNELEDFAILAMQETHMPCHSLVDYEDPDWEIIQEGVAGCAGRAIMWRNTAKMPMPGSPVPRLEADRENVFSNIREFEAHHAR
jgi:hypothetical protein